ncbi:MAG: PEP-CTERM sorting domain-containing protein [Tepidisphaeraceae bacterium]
MLRKALFSVVALSAIASSANAALLEFNTVSNTGTETSEPSTFNDPTVTASSLVVGPGVTPATNGNRLGGSGWFNAGNTAAGNTIAEAVAGNDYIELTITPAAASTYSVTNFQFIFDHSGTGPSGIVVRSSIDSYTTDLASVTGIPTGTVAYQTLNISGLTDLSTATTFRFYGIGATATAGTGGFDTANGATAANFLVNGSVPEPTSLALLGLGGVALMRRRSR